MSETVDFSSHVKGLGAISEFPILQAGHKLLPHKHASNFFIWEVDTNNYNDLVKNSFGSYPVGIVIGRHTYAVVDILEGPTLDQFGHYYFRPKLVSRFEGKVKSPYIVYFAPENRRRLLVLPPEDYAKAASLEAAQLAFNKKVFKAIYGNED